SSGDPEGRVRSESDGSRGVSTVMPKLAFGPWGESMPELRAVASDADARGADSLWVSEMHRSAFIQAAAIATSTTRAPIGTALAHELCSPRYLAERALPRIRAGLRRGGRERKAITVMASACCLPSADVRSARRLAAGLVAFYATVRTYEDFFDFHGFRAEAAA